MELIVRGTACVFVRETERATLAAPTASLPNATDAGKTVVWAPAETAETKQKITVSDNRTALLSFRIRFAPRLDIPISSITFSFKQRRRWPEQAPPHISDF
jgi:hypothetical protein